MEGLEVHSNGSLLKVAVEGCFVTGGGGDGNANLVGLCDLGGCGGGDGTAARIGVSTYSLVVRSESGLGTVSVTGGGCRSGASGAIRGVGALMMGARGRCARGRDVWPPCCAMWPKKLAAYPGSTLVRHRRQLAFDMHE